MKDIGEILCRQQDDAVQLAHCLEPSADAFTEQLVLQKHPGLVKWDQGGRAVTLLQAPLDAPEQIQQHSCDGFFAEVHQVLGLEGDEPAFAQHVFVSIKQVAQGSAQGVIQERLPYALVLLVRAKFRESPCSGSLQ